jgi:hypothetical protein
MSSREIITAVVSTEGANQKMPKMAFSDPRDRFAHISMDFARIEMGSSYIIRANQSAIIDRKKVAKISYTQ